MAKGVQGLNLIGLVVCIAWMIWMHREQSEQLIRLRAEIQTLAKAMNANTKVAAVARPPAQTDTGRQTSPSELHKPAGPMPRSILVESSAEAGQLQPGIDVTSDIRRRKIDPCVKPCQRLSVCALDKKICPSMDTRNQDRIVDMCVDGCRGDRSTQLKLVNSTRCKDAVELAQKRLKGFSNLCRD